MWQVDRKVWKAPAFPSNMVEKFNMYLMNNTGIYMPELEFFYMGNRPAIMVLRGFISVSSVHPVPLNLLSMASPFRSACRRTVGTQETTSGLRLGHSTIQMNQMFHCNRKIIGTVTQLSNMNVHNNTWVFKRNSITSNNIYHSKIMV